MTSGELQQPRAGKQHYNKAFGHSLRTWLPPLLFRASSLHCFWIFPSGWGCSTRHVTEFTSANFPSNLTHAWSSGGNQFAAFTVGWIWTTGYDWGLLCYKYGHVFSSGWKTCRHNPKSGCIKHQGFFEECYNGTNIFCSDVIELWLFTGPCRSLMHHIFVQK